MTPFEHLSVLISIILGLGMVRLLISLQQLVQAIDRVKIYWLPILWAILVFVGQIEWWWSSFEFRNQFNWNFFYFLFILISPISLYLGAAFVLPKIEENSEYDLKQYYYRTRGWLFTFLAIAPMFDAIRRSTRGASITEVEIWSNIVVFIAVSSLAYVRREWYHGLISITVTALFLFFIVMEVLQIG